ncbi:pyridoxal phosphate-dependent enzyme [Escherichia coli]|uniref:Pyridoxal phosphate-dependent enzyme n=1 Tax=Escherichia coli TaxID=562 RepID=A0A376LAK4_ECOLX|nr:pyridoxal phosphate-dependent enzyme [Escherichia coli]
MTQNIYQQLGLKQVINACGKMTILGVSSVRAGGDAGHRARGILFRGD